MPRRAVRLPICTSHDRPCGVKQIFSNSPVDELTGDSARSSCSANCSL